MVEKRIETLLAEKFTEQEFQDCFLVETKLLPNNKLEIFIDCDSGVSLEKCRAISRYLEEYLDAEGMIGEKYVLEVSSPGIGRPLLLKRQYRNNINRKVEVKLRSGNRLKGILLEVQETGILLQEHRKQGNKKKKLVIDHTIAFDDIEKTVVKVTF